MRGKLTALTVGQSKVDADKKRKKLYDGTHGLFLEVFESGAKCWQQRLQISGKRRTRGLGGYPSVSLAQARVLACENWLLAQSGGDPIARRSKPKAVPTFEEAAEAVIARDAPTWRDPKHPQDWRNTLARYAFPTLGHLPVSQIEIHHIVQVLEPIWFERAETARRVRQRIRAILEWAKAHGYRTDNPAAEAVYGALSKRRSHGAQKRHHPAIPYHQLPELIVAVRRMRATAVVRLLFEFVALTVVRSGEARGARWNEFNFDTAVWFIPGSRMKTGFPHRVPLSERALEILHELRCSDAQSDTELVFPGARPGRPPSGDALMGVLRRLSAPYTVHGLRSSFRDWVEENSVASAEAAERALAHARTNQTVKAYLRTDLLEVRRPLMQAWADHVNHVTSV